MSEQIPTTPRLTDGRPEGDGYAVTMLVPSYYFPGSMVEVTAHHNVHGTSAADALAKLNPRDVPRVTAVYPERF